MGLKKVLRKMTLKSSDRPYNSVPVPWLPEPLPKAKTMSMKQAEIIRQAGIDHYYDHCHKVMEIALENIIDYSEFKAMKPELTKGELDKAYFDLFDKWDILKHIMLRFVKIDAELGCLDVLISFGGDFGARTPSREILVLVLDRNFFTATSVFDEVQALAQILDSIPHSERKSTLELLRVMRPKYYKFRDGAPPPRGPDPDFALNRVRHMMRDYRQSQESKQIQEEALILRMSRIQDAISQLPFHQQTEFKLARESMKGKSIPFVRDANGGGNPFSRGPTNKENFHFDENGNRKTDPAVMEMLKANAMKGRDIIAKEEWATRMAIRALADDAGEEETEDDRKSKELAQAKTLARLNGWD